MSGHETRYTSGPWECQPGHSDWGMPTAHVIVQCGDTGNNMDNWIAEIHSVTPYCAGAHPKDIRRAQQQLANAYLIAAAPELLEALVDAERMFEHTWAMNGTVHKRIKDAISKATNTPLPATPQQADSAGAGNPPPPVPATNSPGPHLSGGSGGSRSNPSEDDVRAQKCSGASSPAAGRVRDAGQLVRQSSQAATNSEKG